MHIFSVHSKAKLSIFCTKHYVIYAYCSKSLLLWFNLLSQFNWTWQIAHLMEKKISRFRLIERSISFPQLWIEPRNNRDEALNRDTRISQRQFTCQIILSVTAGLAITARAYAVTYIHAYVTSSIFHCAYSRAIKMHGTEKYCHCVCDCNCQCDQSLDKNF